MRVAFAVDNLGIGGTETNLVRLATRLDRARFPLVVTYARGGPLLATLEAAGIPTFQFQPPSLRSLALPGAVRAFRRWLAAERIQILHAHDVYSNVFDALCAPPGGPVRLIVSRRWGLTQYGRLITWANRWAYGRAARVLGNSTGVGDSLVTDEGVPRAKVVVLPNFADDAVFAQAGDPRALRTELGLPLDAPVIGMVANLHAVKNHALLLDAVAGLAGAPHLALIGEGPEREALVAQAARLGIADRVHLLGSRPGAGRFHAAFDVSCLTSRSEGFPNTLVEAMAAARPVVATDVGGVRDAVQDGVTGLLAPSGDVERVRAHFARLLGDPALRTQMGAAGLAHARAEFHADAVMPRLERVYRELIEGPAPRA
ncbi:MAG: glycosyltransferase [Gemmatimonadetes bacterium]|nr:glycosyltransferase [Gemmatimonadota bacterium]